MTQQEESLITDEMRASIGVESPPVTYEVDKTGVRMFARAVGHKDRIFYDEAYAKSRGHRSLVAPPSFLGTPIFDPEAPARTSPTAGMRSLNGGNEFEYTDVDICAGDVLTAIAKTLSMVQRSGAMGPMIISRRETTYTNQNGEVVCRAYMTSINY